MKIDKKRLALLTSFFLVLLCVLLLKIYRPYIYRNQLFDFHFADTITSFLSVPAGSLLFWGVFQVKFIKCLTGSLLGFLIYEFIGLIFDWYDIVALLLSGGITYLAYIIYKKDDLLFALLPTKYIRSWRESLKLPESIQVLIRYWTLQKR